MDQTKAANLMRTPFVRQQSTGNWALFLIKNMALEWGHRFDAGIGYRVFIKFGESQMINAFPAGECRRVATMISNNETNEDILNIGIVMKRLADEVEKLNKQWAALGAPDQPLDQMEGGRA